VASGRLNVIKGLRRTNQIMITGESLHLISSSYALNNILLRPDTSGYLICFSILRHSHANYPNRRSNTTAPLAQPLVLPTTPPSSESPIPIINYFASSEPKIRSPSMLQDVESGMTACIGSPRKSFDMPRQRSTASH
jgi:hypothetical protein